MIADPLVKHEQYRIKIEDIRIIVYTNTQYPSNWYLSSARAIAVAEYYINEKGFNQDEFRLMVLESMPILLMILRRTAKNHE